MRELHPEWAPWIAGDLTATILADFIDIYIAAHTEKGRTPKTYPRRPDATQKTKRHFGADPISTISFEEWWNRKE